MPVEKNSAIRAAARRISKASRTSEGVSGVSLFAGPVAAGSGTLLSRNRLSDNSTNSGPLTFELEASVEAAERSASSV